MYDSQFEVCNLKFVINLQKFIVHIAQFFNIVYCSLKNL